MIVTNTRVCRGGGQEDGAAARCCWWCGSDHTSALRYQVALFRVRFLFTVVSPGDCSSSCTSEPVNTDRPPAAFLLLPPLVLLRDFPPANSHLLSSRLWQNLQSVIPIPSACCTFAAGRIREQVGTGTRVELTGMLMPVFVCVVLV